MTETAKLIVAIVGVGVAVCGVNGAGLYVMSASVDAFRAEAAGVAASDRAEAAALAASDRAEAAADRRALQDAMDTFRQEMLRLAERQARVEGQLSLMTPEKAP